MNDHERKAWIRLSLLGAKAISIGGKVAIDLTPIRITTQRNLDLFVEAIVEVVGRSGHNRRHVNRQGSPVFVVTDDAERP